jgi:hypothetical protein
MYAYAFIKTSSTGHYNVHSFSCPLPYSEDDVRLHKTHLLIINKWKCKAVDKNKDEKEFVTEREHTKMDKILIVLGKKKKKIQGNS